MYRLNFTTITPLHISNGEILDQNFHYVTLRDKFYKLDQFKTATLIAKKENIDFSEEITVQKIESWIKNYQLELLENATSYSVKIHPNFEAHLQNAEANGRRQVIEFIQSNGKFYVPASSIKGAMLTPLGIHLLGIDPKHPKIEDRVVFADSDYIPSERFSVYRTENRPPENNIICLDPDNTFSLIMRKKGNLDKNKFFDSIKRYTKIQLDNLQKEVFQDKSQKLGKLRKADLFLLSIKPIVEMVEKGKVLFNIGYGGGSWFKINQDKIPKFKSKVPGQKEWEAAHSSYSFTLQGSLRHIGWCTVEIEDI